MELRNWLKLLHLWLTYWNPRGRGFSEGSNRAGQMTLVWGGCFPNSGMARFKAEAWSRWVGVLWSMSCSLLSFVLAVLAQAEWGRESSLEAETVLIYQCPFPIKAPHPPHPAISEAALTRLVRWQFKGLVSVTAPGSKDLSARFFFGKSHFTFMSECHASSLLFTPFLKGVGDLCRDSGNSGPFLHCYVECCFH